MQNVSLRIFFFPFSKFRLHCSLFFCFSCLILFSFGGHLAGFILVGKVFGKASRILVLDERKGSWAVKQDVEIFGSMLHAFFSGLRKWIVLILIWFERSLHSAQVSGQSCPWPLKLMASLADPYGPFSSLCTAARPLPSEKIEAPSPISEGSGRLYTRWRFRSECA